MFDIIAKAVVRCTIQAMFKVPNLFLMFSRSIMWLPEENGFDIIRWKRIDLSPCVFDGHIIITLHRGACRFHTSCYKSINRRRSQLTQINIICITILYGRSQWFALILVHIDILRPPRLVLRTIGHAITAPGHCDTFRKLWIGPVWDIFFLLIFLRSRLRDAFVAKIFGRIELCEKKLSRSQNRSVERVPYHTRLAYPRACIRNIRNTVTEPTFYGRRLLTVSQFGFLPRNN